LTRTALLQQCISRNSAVGNETVCYKELGCFEMEYPWVSQLRPLPSPASPEEIDVKLRYFSRDVKDGPYVDLWPEMSLNETDFNPNRTRTVFMVHGFASYGNASWLLDLKDAYLKRVDANVFVVDWGDGAQKVNYLQVASNTRIVGAELARFGNFLLKKGQNKSSLHLIGHSLGAHIMAYLSKGLEGEGKPWRLTALDPAQPAFEKTDAEVRLDKEDAVFVEAIHTDARPFIPLIGFGMIFPVGDVDFYVNGGSSQPGCIIGSIPEIKSINDLATVPVEVVSSWVSCSHGRSYEYFTAALNLDNCTFWGRKMSHVENYVKLLSLGTLATADTLVKTIVDCKPETCIPFGLDSPKYNSTGNFAVTTSSKEPYCQTSTTEERALRALYKIGSSTTGWLQGAAKRTIGTPINKLKSFG